MQFAFDPCPEDRAFRFQHGARARSLDEFRTALRAAPAEAVQFHRTHFHPWVRDILRDPQLAERVRAEGERARDGEQLRRALDPLLEQALRTEERTAKGRR
ncbi:MAG TPA: hypothetical protein VGR28_03755 [Candidatus Thermoplasmatota archaeon]|jgi:hypothetical protein|nr:hypothetical protein [Candidatus Thermoplasmatota archaeon]